MRLPLLLCPRLCRPSPSALSWIFLVGIARTKKRVWLAVGGCNGFPPLFSSKGNFIPSSSVFILCRSTLLRLISSLILVSVAGGMEKLKMVTATDSELQSVIKLMKAGWLQWMPGSTWRWKWAVRRLWLGLKRKQNSCAKVNKGKHLT